MISIGSRVALKDHPHDKQAPEGAPEGVVTGILYDHPDPGDVSCDVEWEDRARPSRERDHHLQVLTP